jgi:hypothetical protein
MYVEAKTGHIDGAAARIGWVTFSRSGRSVRYRDLTLARIKGGGISGNYFDEATGREFWVSGVKTRGSNRHPSESGVSVVVDPDAVEAFNSLRIGDRA